MRIEINGVAYDPRFHVRPCDLANMAPKTPTTERFYSTTLDDATHKAAVRRMKADKITRAEFTRRAIAAYLDLESPEVKPGRPWT